MTYQEAKSLADKSNSRNDLEIIEDGIREAAGKGEYIYNSKLMGPVQSSEYKKYFQILGFDVCRCSELDRDTDVIYYLNIAW